MIVKFRGFYWKKTLKVVEDQKDPFNFNIDHKRPPVTFYLFILIWLFLLRSDLLLVYNMSNSIAVRVTFFLAFV